MTIPHTNPEMALRILKELYARPSWLFDGETIEWDTFYENEDNLALRGCIWSLNPWTNGLMATATIHGKVLRMAAYTGRKSMLIEAIDREQQAVMRTLEDMCQGDVNLLPLASQALQDDGSDGALGVLIDALLEAGHITVHEPPERLDEPSKRRWSHMSLERTAMAYAKHILSPRIFGSWDTKPWPVAVRARADRIERRFGFVAETAAILRPLWPR